MSRLLSQMGSVLTTLCGAALCLFSCSAALALDPARPLAEFTLESWGREDGLPHGLVIDLLQSADGYIWAATWQGAVRFNGREFRVFDQQRLPWNRDGAVWALSGGADGSLLLGSQRYGVSRLRGGRWSEDVSGDAVGSRLLSLAEDSQGRLWVGTERGLLRIDKGGTQRLSIEAGLPSASVLSLAPASDDVLWVGTANGVARIEGDALRAYGLEQGLPPGEIGMVMVASDGSVRVGTKQGAYRLQDDHFVRDPPELPTDQVSSLLVDRRGSLWIGTIGSGVYRFNGSSLEHLGVEQGLPNNHVNSLLEDAQGNLWIATHGGLTQLRETRFALYSKRDGLADDFVRAVAEDAQGNIWVASNDGISRITAGRIESLAARYPDAALSTLSILPRANGEIWFGTYSKGVRILDVSGMRTLDRRDGLVGDEIRSLMDARDGSVWVGTASGLTQWRDGVARSWTEVADASRTIYVRALLETADGGILIGMQAGVARMRGDSIEMVDPTHTDAINTFNLSECVHGHVWISGQGGVWRLRDGRIETLDARFKLDTTTVFALRADTHGTDWLTTADGLLAIEHAQLEAAMDDELETLPMIRYGDGPGSEALALNGGSTPSASLARDGRIWLATSQGVAVFQPQELDGVIAPPPTVIERVQVDGADWDLAAMPRLSAGTRRIEFDYAGLSFLAPESVRYLYRLEGFEDRWIDAGAATSVGFTNLEPGDYRFQVEAVVAGASAPAHRAQAVFSVDPDWHQTTAFRLGTPTGIGLIGVLAYRRRTQSLRRQAQILRGQVDERTQELTLRSQSLERADAEKAELIKQLREQSALLERHAQEDGLTGLPNRRHFDARAVQMIEDCRADSRPIAMALIDIDLFKRINDTYGHTSGDEVLRGIARLLLTHATAPFIAGRYGGEEFAALLPNIDLATAADWCESLRGQIERYDFSHLAADLQVTVSIGVAANFGDLARAYAAADQQLYKAKHAGRNRVFVG